VLIDAAGQNQMILHLCHVIEVLAIDGEGNVNEDMRRGRSQQILGFICAKGLLHLPFCDTP
jgi:hypothetical protein